MNVISYPAQERGHANHGWLIANHSFSFASWQNPQKMNFGALRVLNDDIIAPGMGFGAHPHSNMEIITLVQEGALTHKDSMGNGATMYANEVQVMSAGSGVTHSEFNASSTEALKLFQIWLFTHTENVAPRYEQQLFDPNLRKNQWQTIIKPNTDALSEGIFIYQNAWFSLVDLDAGTNIEYTSKLQGNGAYVFIIEGEAKIGENKLGTRDALGITNYTNLKIEAVVNTRILLIDVVMD